MSDLDLTGATVLHVHPGDRLLFVVNAKLSLAQASEMRGALQAFMPGIEISVCDKTDQVVVQEAVDDAGA